MTKQTRRRFTPAYKEQAVADGVADQSHPGLRAASVGVEDGRAGLVREELRRRLQDLDEPGVDGPQLPRGVADPVGEGGAVELDALTGEHPRSICRSTFLRSRRSYEDAQLLSKRRRRGRLRSGHHEADGASDFDKPAVARASANAAAPIIVDGVTSRLRRAFR